MRYCWLIGLLILFGVGLAQLPDAQSRGQPKGDEVTLREVKYADLAKEVLKNRGKVVVVDLWGVG